MKRSWFEVKPGKKFARHHLNQQMGMVPHACHPRSWEAKFRRVTVQGQLRQKSTQDPISAEENLGMLV
jgi:hypothetical protein